MCKRSMLLIVGVVCLVGLVGVSPALAESAWWKLATNATPTVLTPGGKARIVVEASNLGDGPVLGNEKTVTVALSVPSWFTPTAVEGVAGPTEYQAGKPSGGILGGMSCAVLPALSCTYGASLPAFGTLEMIVTGTVSSSPPASGMSEATVEGGETRGTSARQMFTTGPSTPFGVERYELAPEEEGGLPDAQAGSHPFQLTSTVALNEKTAAGILRPTGPELAKDLDIKLPPGLVGNANLIPQCDEVQFTSFVEGAVNLCPASTAVGVALVTLNEPAHLFYTTNPVPIFNLTPGPGEPARFGFVVEGSPVILDTAVRTGSDYGVTVSVHNLTELASFVKSEVTFWGVPGAEEHAASRGWSCVAGDLYVGAPYDAAQPEPCDEREPSPKGFLTLPTSCAGPLQSSIEIDSWERPGHFTEPMSSADAPLSMAGCGRLAFAPTIGVAPDGQAASTPTGLTVGVHVPQEVSLSGAGDAEADVKNTTVALPAGVQLSPSAADGLQACAQLHGTEPAQEAAEGKHEVSGINLETPQAANCPDASKVATVNISTPLLPHELKGAVYLAAPQNFKGLPENPFESLVALYLVAEDPVSGVLVKLAGKVSPDPVTGQITTTFENTPQLPFENLELHFFGTDRAPLATPAYCGSYETKASIEPWSTPGGTSSSGVAQLASAFAIETGPHGSTCTYPGQALPFSPSLNAESTNINAGNFSPLQTTITREDGQQNIQAVQLHFPPGLSGILSGVKLCGEAQANAGTCGPESLIGSTIVSVGLGGDPFSVTGGKVYLTEKIAGSPTDASFGLSIVNPAKAGPFVLEEGRPVVVRAQIEVNPTTAALTVTTDNSGPYKIPSILDGIPLEIKHVNVTIERPGFTFNPTNCDPQHVTGTVNSTEGASSNVSVPFQVTNCTALKFAPKFAVSTPGKTSKARGAGLHVKLTYPAAAFGSEANIARVKVDLPKQLPSQLKTLQKACLAKTFEANPEGCPKHSIVGQAKVITPLLPVPLTGNAYFVSHGGEAFPSLTIVLKGYGVTVDLVGSTFIHGGITSSTFKTVPDLPFSSFELTLNQGEFAALNTNLPEKLHGNLCGQKLVMPTAFVAQNGAEIHESTKISISGCKKAKPAKKKKKAAAKKRKK